MNLYYLMSNEYDGLNKFASEYINDADNLTGLFYGMLKEAARTNRKGGHGVRRTVSTPISLDTPEGRADATEQSIRDRSKAEVKRARNIANDEKAGRQASAVRGRQVLNAKKLSNMKNALGRYEKDVPHYLDNINALKATNADLTRTIDANNATMFNLRGDIDRLVKDKDAMRSGYEATISEMGETAAKEAKRAKRKLQIAQILNNRRVRSLEAQHAANATALATKLDDAGKALMKSNRLGKFKLTGGLLGGAGLGAGALAAYNSLQNKTAAAPATSGGIDFSDPRLQRTLGYTGGGAALGGLVGALSSDENKVRNSLIGATLGGLGGYAFDRYGHKPVADLIRKHRA